MSTLDADKLAGIFVKMRDARHDLLAKYEAADAAIKEQQDVIKSTLLDLCNTIGGDSIKTKHGTVIRSIKERYWTTEWAPLYDFIMEQGAPELLEKRIHQTNIKQWIAEHPDNHPPGLNLQREFDITVRRS